MEIKYDHHRTTALRRSTEVMTKEATSTAIAVMQAFCEGKPIESLIDGKWVKVTNPCWNWDEFAYRVKPGPREFWIVPDGEDYRAYDQPIGNCPNRIKVREVMDE